MLTIYCVLYHCLYYLSSKLSSRLCQAFHLLCLGVIMYGQNRRLLLHFLHPQMPQLYTFSVLWQPFPQTRQLVTMEVFGFSQLIFPLGNFISQKTKLFERRKRLPAKSSLALVAGAWTERKKMYHGGSFLKLAHDNVQIKNPKAQKRGLRGF